MEFKFSQSLILASFVKVSVSSNMFLELAALNLPRILPNQTKEKRLQTPGWAQKFSFKLWISEIWMPLKIREYLLLAVELSIIWSWGSFCSLLFFFPPSIYTEVSLHILISCLLE